MYDNMALLSQEEIDTLLQFLFDQKKDVTGEVMDQASIDKLISILRADQKRSIHFDSQLTRLASKSSAIIKLELPNGLAQSSLSLSFEVYGDGYLKAAAVSSDGGASYAITPNCFDKFRYIANDKSEWGRFLPPVTFDSIAGLLNIKYTKDTFDKVCRTFAKNMCNNEESQVPAVFMPSANDLIAHLFS